MTGSNLARKVTLPRTRAAQPAGWLALHLLLPVSLLVLWQLLSLSWPHTVRYATPLGVLSALFDLIGKGDLQLAALISLKHVGVAFVLAVLSGGALGLAMGYWPALDRWVGPLVNTLRPIAPYAWIPLAILWLGIGDATAIAIVTYSAFFPMVLNAISGARNVDRNLIAAARALGAGPRTLLVRVLFPATLPSMLVGARLAMGSAWVAVVAAELACGARGGRGATGGLGQMMFMFYAYASNLNQIVVCIIAVGVLALLSDRLIHRLYGSLSPWMRAG
jgi:ABC-type nitrate/sulfonate/bicarbonate transport system permease component